MSDAYVTFDKRAFPRYPAHISVNFLVMKEHKEVRDIREMVQQKKMVHTVDASLGGMKFEANQDLAAGDILTLKFSIPTKSLPISAFAEVIWASTRGVGVHFLTIKEDDLKSLDVFLQSIPKGS
jgi:hypothetical protein